MSCAQYQPILHLIYTEPPGHYYLLFKMSHQTNAHIQDALTQNIGDDADAGKAHSSEEPHNSKHDEGLRECTGYTKGSGYKVRHHQHGFPTISNRNRDKYKP